MRLLMFWVLVSMASAGVEDPVAISGLAVNPDGTATMTVTLSAKAVVRLQTVRELANRQTSAANLGLVEYIDSLLTMTFDDLWRAAREYLQTYNVSTTDQQFLDRAKTVPKPSP